jgi:hypothetical protein
MSEVTKEAQELSIIEVMAALEKNGSNKGSRFVDGRVWTRMPVTAEMMVGVNLPPQARVLVRLILEGEGTWTEAELCEMVEAGASALNTKQEPWKIFTYYSKKLQDAGFISKNK